MEIEDIITIIVFAFVVFIIALGIYCSAISELKETTPSADKIECYETYLLENVKLKKCESIFKELYEEE